MAQLGATMMTITEPHNSIDCFRELTASCSAAIPNHLQHPLYLLLSNTQLSVGRKEMVEIVEMRGDGTIRGDDDDNH
jgi:hypothetical protein